MEDTQAINVVLVEDHLAVRKGIELVFRRDGIHVIGVADNPELAVALAARRAPHVVVLDLGLPGADGLEVARRMSELDPAPAVLIYTGGGKALDDLLACPDAPVAGIALKAGPPAELVEAVRRLAAGGSYRDPRLHPSAEYDAVEPVLSTREREVLGLLARGLSGAQVARELYLSPETVRTHVRNAATRLGARTRTQAIALAVQLGEIDVPPAVAPDEA